MNFSSSKFLNNNKYKAIAFTILASLLVCGCHSKPQPSQIKPTPPLISKQTEEAPDSQAAPSSVKTPIKDSINAVIAKNSEIFPKDTKLNGMSLKKKVATLDFSPEFNKLATMGEGKESEAQQKLRGALAEFPSVHEMRVTVQSKPFQSQATDWSTPFPVRDSELNQDESNGNAMEMTPASDKKMKRGDGRVEGSPR